MYGYEEFTRDVHSLTGINLAEYKERQMKRRIESLIKRHKLAGFKEFVEAIRKDNELYEEFLSYLTINVSEFYRNPEQWRVLSEEVVPELLKNNHNQPLKIWSAACSTGDEPYSLVMMLSKFMPLSKITIEATDIDKQIIAKAKLGVYNDKSIENLPQEFKNKYFTEVGASSYRISDDIKNCVKFKQHNLLKDNYGSGYDLIVCRNVMIYFTEEAKDGIYRRFYQALKDKGVLFVGSTEQMMKADSIGFTSFRSFFYIK